MYMSIILAAGDGSRMKSDMPKPLHKVCGKEMIKYIIEALQKLDIQKNVVVLGHSKEKIEESIMDYNTITVEQPIGEGKPYGTGYAAMMSMDNIDDDDTVLILSADVPLITEETLFNFIRYHENGGYAASVLTVKSLDPTGYGRIVRNYDDAVDSIIEYKHASKEIRKIKEINTGIFCFNGSMLKYSLSKINMNDSNGEYYLADTIKVLSNENYKVGACILPDDMDVKIVNDRVQLAKVNKIMQQRINKRHMLLGVTMINPKDTYIDDIVIIGNDTTIYPGTILEQGTSVGKNCIIGPNTRIINSEIKDWVNIESSKVIDSYIDEKTTVGPFAYLRPGTRLGKNVKIGDFVEVKKSVIGDNSKSSHLSYIGDADIGKDVNIGCGVVFVNYDGKNKNRTIVGDGAFVGSNSNLVAPVTIHDGGYVACGSTITNDVETDDLAIARARQVNKKGLGKNRY